MHFVHPAFLWALWSLAIPVIIHFFGFRKVRTIQYSDTHWLTLVFHETLWKKKVKHILVLLARLLALLFLILAFAQPYLPATDSIRTETQQVVIYLDNSYSMSAPLGELTSDQSLRCLDAGVEMVRKLLSTFPVDTRYRFITNEFDASSYSFQSKQELLDHLVEIRLSAKTRSWADIQDHIGSDGVTTVFWISDFQRSTLGDVAVLDPSWQLHLATIKSRNMSNVFVDTVSLAYPWVAGDHNRLLVKLTNSGQEEVQKMPCKLVLNGIQTAVTSVDIDANHSVTVPFDLKVIPGNTLARVTIGDFPMSFDNDFFLALQRTSAVRIVEIVEDMMETSYVQKVYSNKNLFTYRSFLYSQPDYQALKTADLVIVSSASLRQEVLLSSLVDYKNKGGNILIVPSVGVQTDGASTLVQQPITSVQVADNWMELDVPDWRLPFFVNVFESPQSNLSMPRARKIWEWGEDRSAILSFKDGSPYLSHVGGIFILSSPLHPSYTSLVEHALFVPLMYRLGLFHKGENQLYYRLPTSHVTWPIDSLARKGPIKLVNSHEIIPSQFIRNHQIHVDLSLTDIKPGLYWALQQDTLGLLAFNFSSRESKMDFYTQEEMLQKVKGSFPVVSFQTSSLAEAKDQIQFHYEGRPLWKYALLICLTSFFCEILLIRFLP